MENKSQEKTSDSKVVPLQPIQKPKKKLTERLQLLNDGRPHYLEFLRNLAPQSVLLSLALLLMFKLDLGRIDINNWPPTFAFLMFVGAFFFAFYANTTWFYERCFAEWRIWLKKTQDSLVSQDVKRFAHIPTISKIIWRERFVELLEVIVAIFFLQVALAGVLFTAIHSASSIWHANHPKENKSSVEPVASNKPEVSFKLNVDSHALTVPSHYRDMSLSNHVRSYKNMLSPPSNIRPSMAS